MHACISCGVGAPANSMRADEDRYFDLLTGVPALESASLLPGSQHPSRPPTGGKLLALVAKARATARLHPNKWIEQVD